MKKIKIACLANSYKEGGRCVAGVLLNNDGSPAMPLEWIRLVCATPHNEIPTACVSTKHPLDILDVLATEKLQHDFQTENMLFDTETIQTTGAVKVELLDQMCDSSSELLLGNKASFLHEHEVVGLKTSITLIKVDTFELFQQKEEDRPYPKFKLRFRFQNTEYALPISDPLFLQLCKRNPRLLDGIKTLYLTISLGSAVEGILKKYVACILC